jgi:hypothetical protein
MIISINGKINSGKDSVGKIIQYLTDGTNTKNLSFTKWCIVNEYSNHHMWKIRKFAGKLKQMVSILTGIPVKDIEKQEVKDMELGEDWWYYQELKQSPNTVFMPNPMISYLQVKGTQGQIELERVGLIKLHKPTVRWMLQQLGTEAIRNNIHPNAWVNALFVDYTAFLKRYPQIKWSNKKPLIAGNEYMKATGNPEIAVLPNWIITDMRFPNEFDAVKARNGICVRIVRHNHPHDTEPHISETALDNYTFDYTIDNSSNFGDLIEQVRSMLKQFKLIT